MLSAQKTSQKLGTHNALILSLAQAFNGSIGAIAVSIGALAGAWLSPQNLALATLPVAAFSVGAAVFAYPVAMLARKFGRKASFIIGAIIGIFGAGFSVLALVNNLFPLFCLGFFMVGGSNAFIQQYRFAAADIGTDKFKSRAISWVLTGGIFAALIGTETVLRTKDLLLPIPFAGAFLGMAGLLVVGIGILAFLKPTDPEECLVHENAEPARHVSKIFSQPVFVVALLCAVATYGLMTFVMTGAPLAMQQNGHSEVEAVLGIRWHVLAMFGPSFITGVLIVKFGKLPVIGAGLVLLMVCAGVALSGLELWNFWWALILLGIGWNFGFIGATALLNEAYCDSERNKVQGLHDFILFSSVAASSLASGAMLHNFGWNGVVMVLFPVCGLAILSLIWLQISNMRVQKFSTENISEGL